MKPAPFELFRPADLDDALVVLADDPDDSKVLAGGQSLIPMMNFRLARPGRLIDINRVRGLAGIESDSGSVAIRSCTRHVDLQRNDIGGPLGALLRQAAGNVGHMPIRTRGTFGGSLAHCDSASEWCVVATLLDAEMTVQSHWRGVRTIAAADCFLSMFTTALEPDEILTRTTLPALDDTYRAGIAEYARRTGDFGIIVTAAAIQVVDGMVGEARICVGGVAPIPVRCRTAERFLRGQDWSRDVVVAAADVAADEVNPPNDAHADADYRRALIRALLPRAVGHQGDGPTP